MFARRLVFAATLAILLAVPAVAHGATAGNCAWALRSDPDRGNIAYPDSSAEYWVGSWVPSPGTRLVIDGSYPHARYMSFHVYEGSIPLDKQTDYQLRPARGVNPFVAGARRAHPGSYGLQVVPQAPPASGRRAPNTLYAGRGTNGEPLAAVTIIYRVYLGEGDAAGGVALPRVTEQAGGSQFALPSCPSSQLQQNTGANSAIAGESVPASWPPGTRGTPPRWQVASSSGSRTQIGPFGVRAGNPFFPNFDNTYLSLAVTRAQGEVVAFRAKAPTFVHSRHATRMGTGQLRYWSFCTNDQYTTRYVACVPDQDAKLDAAGYVTVVVSDAAHRPRHLSATDNWLAWGPYADVFLLYRHMLPARSFAHAVQRVPANGNPALTMGPYYPQTVFCSTAQFERNRCGLPLVRTRRPHRCRSHRRHARACQRARRHRR